MNEYLPLIAIVAIPVVTYLLVRRSGIVGTPKGKFWIALSAGPALVLLVVTNPEPGGSVYFLELLVLIVAYFVWEEYKSARRTEAKKTHFWVALTLGSTFVALVLTNPSWRGVTTPAGLCLVGFAFWVIWIRYRAFHKQVL